MNIKKNMLGDMVNHCEPYILHSPDSNPLPIVISCPHVGTEVPAQIASTMTHSALENPDADWFVHELYSFAPAMGISLLQARFSRFVIDLNRDPSGARLYSDQRIETSLVPSYTFNQSPIYLNNQPDKNEIKYRLQNYYEPYHQMLTNLLKNLRKQYQHILLIDAHSIRRSVPTIRTEPFADIILGDQLGKTADHTIATCALKALQNFDTKYNDPFMGGYITRFFGNPSQGIHALQIEMSQDIYMNEATHERDQIKEQQVQLHLKNLFIRLNQAVEHLL